MVTITVNHKMSLQELESRLLNVVQYAWGSDKVRIYVEGNRYIKSHHVKIGRLTNSYALASEIFEKYNTSKPD